MMWYNSLLTTIERSSQVVILQQLSLPITPTSHPSFPLGWHLAAFHKLTVIGSIGDLLLLCVPQTSRIYVSLKWSFQEFCGSGPRILNDRHGNTVLWGTLSSTLFIFFIFLNQKKWLMIMGRQHIKNDGWRFHFTKFPKFDSAYIYNIFISFTRIGFWWFFGIASKRNVLNDV
jgi:hypothetical protein